MRLQDTKWLTFRKLTTPLISGHLFQNLTPGQTYSVHRCVSHLLVILDNSGKEIHISKASLNKFFFFHKD